MIVKIRRGKAFSGAELEIDTEKVIKSDAYRLGGGGRVSMEDGGVYSLTKDEWAQWVGGVEGSFGRPVVVKVDVPAKKKVKEEVLEVPDKKSYRNTIREGLLKRSAKK